jgi:hypothetical protein
MKAFPEVHWHLLPGNHDPHRPEGVWDRVAQIGLPQNIHLHLTPAPFAFDAQAFLLPAPLTRKAEAQDLTAWMDAAPTPAGALRIGLAHGCVTNFGGDGEATNPINPDRSKSARLDYLALGDWHRTLQIGPAAWYAGTPEPDRAGGQELGTALSTLPAPVPLPWSRRLSPEPIVGPRAPSTSPAARNLRISKTGFAAKATSHAWSYVCT